jgi:exodeoxyribonuclease V alpha subunit
LLHVLSTAADDGHCFLPQPELIELTVQQLTNDSHEADEEAVRAIIEEMGQQKELIVEIAEGEMPLCYKPSFFYTEQNLAQLLLQHLSHPNAVDLPRVQNWMARYTESRQITLSPHQSWAVEMAASSRIMILTGGPGCGKTFCTSTIVALWKAMGKRIALAAPTGRAAKRMSDPDGTGGENHSSTARIRPS